MEIKVGKAYYVTQFSGAKRKRILQKDSFFYIPVEAILTALLHRRDVHEHIQHFHGSADAVRRDISVMAISLETILFFLLTRQHYKLLFILMKLNCVIH